MAPTPDAWVVLDELVKKTGITQYDAILAGDGSAQGWTTPAGWACVVVDRLHRGRQLLHGACNRGSIGFAESQAYLHGLNWYDDAVGKELLRQTGVLNIHIITDSANVCHWGTVSQQDGVTLPRKHIPIWAAFREYKRVGYRFTFHWAPRLSNGFNWLSDLVAGLSMRSARNVPEDGRVADNAILALSQIAFGAPNAEEIDIYSLHED